MRGIQFERAGTLSELKYQELPQPVPELGEVLVEIHAAAINPSDVKNVLGMMAHTTLPRIPGRDFAGIAVEGPPNMIGTEVWGTGGELGFTRDGTHAEYIVLPEDAVRPKPKALSVQEAAAVGASYVTAWLGLARASLFPGETLLVIGATGAVGSAAMQIAKWKGAQTIGTVRNEAHSNLARQLGAETTVNLRQEDLREAVFEATEGKGADVIFDTVGGSMFEKCLEALAPGGRLIEIATPLQERQVCFDLLEFYRRDLRLVGVNSLHLDAKACAGILEQLTPAIEANILRPLIAASYPLKDAIAAYEQVQNRSSIGKVLITSR